jgi:hypothetical protein
VSVHEVAEVLVNSTGYLALAGSVSGAGAREIASLATVHFGVSRAAWLAVVMAAGASAGLFRVTASAAVAPNASTAVPRHANRTAALIVPPHGAPLRPGDDQPYPHL